KGGAGNDTLKVMGVGATGTIRLDPDSRLQIDLQGGLGNDTITTDLGKADALGLMGAIRLRLSGGLGSDILTAMLASDTTTTGSFDVAVFGDQGDDQMTFQLTSNA